MMVVYRAKRKGGPGSTGRPIDLDCAPMAAKFTNGETIDLTTVARAAGRDVDTSTFWRARRLFTVLVRIRTQTDRIPESVQRTPATRTV